MRERTRRVRRAVYVGSALLLLWLCFVARRIVDEGDNVVPARADVAIVLGAAVVGSQPSPVFRERIRHAVMLQRSGFARKLIMTGGRGAGQRFAEASVARRYALRNGVPADAILTETTSRTTRQNLFQARRIMRAKRLRTALIVSDPLHMHRALMMSRDLGLDAIGVPTPTTRYRTWRTKTGFLLRELYFYHHYLATGQ